MENERNPLDANRPVEHNITGFEDFDAAFESMLPEAPPEMNEATYGGLVVPVGKLHSPEDLDTLDQIAAGLDRKITDYRAKTGAEPLEYSTVLAEAATKRAKAKAAGMPLVPVALVQQQLGVRQLEEILGFGKSADDIFEAMILTGEYVYSFKSLRFSHVGIGIAAGAGMYYVSVLVA